MHFCREIKVIGELRADLGSLSTPYGNTQGNEQECLEAALNQAFLPP